MTRVLCLHGFEGDCQSLFWPQVIRDLSPVATVFAPDLPQPESPVCEEWIQSVEALVGDEPLDLVLCHSLGGTLAMNMLSQGRLNTTKLITIGSSHGPKGEDSMDGFLVPPLKMAPLQELETFYAVTSYDDPATHSDYSSLLVKQAGAVGIFYQGYGHFICDELPPLVMKLVLDCLNG